MRSASSRVFQVVRPADLRLLVNDQRPGSGIEGRQQILQLGERLQQKIEEFPDREVGVQHA